MEGPNKLNKAKNGDKIERFDTRDHTHEIGSEGRAQDNHRGCGEPMMEHLATEIADPAKMSLTVPSEM